MEEELEYECNDCGEEFAVPVDDEPKADLVVCPNCGGTNTSEVGEESSEDDEVEEENEKEDDE